MSTIKKNVIWSLAGNVLPLIAGLIFLPLVLKAYGIDKLGLIMLAWALIGYFGLFDLGLSRALTQLLSKLLEQKKHPNDISELLVTSFRLMWLLGAIGGILLWFLSPYIVSNLLEVTSSLRSESVLAFSILAISIPIVVHSSALKGVLEALHLFKAASIIRMVLGVFTFAAPWLSSLYSTSLISAVIALIVVRAIVWLMYFVEVNHAGLMNQHAHGFNRAWLKPLFSFGGWITLSNIIGPIMMYMDRFVIVSILGVSSVAFYVAPYEVVTKLLVIPAAISSVLFPFFARSSVSRVHESAVKLNQGLTYSLILLFPLCLIGSYFSGEWLSLWLGNAFSEQGKYVVIWLVAGILLNGISQVLFAKVQGFGRSDWTAILHLLELIPYLLLLWYGLKQWGIVGAAFAWFVRVLIDTVGLVFLAGKINLLNVQQSAKTLIIIFIAMLGLLLALCFESFWYRVAVFTFFLVVYSIYAFIKIHQEWPRLFVKVASSEVQDA